MTAVTGHGLALPDDGVASGLRAAYARYLATCCQQFLELAPRLPEALRPGQAALARLIRGALERGQRQVITCFASPMVGTPLQCVALRDELTEFRERIDTATAAMLPALLFELALRGLVPEGESVLLEGGAPPIASLALGGELAPPDGASAWRLSASHVTAIGAAGELARTSFTALRAGDGDLGGFRLVRRFHRIGRVAHLATVDHNPIAAFEAHPDKAGNHVDLGGHADTEWLAMLAESFALVEQYLPAAHAEMATLLHEIVPVGYDAEKHLSASYREAVGTVYLTLHPNVMTMTEAVIHEFQHNKLNVAAYSAAFLHNAFAPLYKSPVRPDPRPLWGILLAVHAFLPVAELYRRMRDGGHAWAARPDFTRRMTEIDLKNHEGMEMLRAHAEFTPAGRALFDELEALERRHMAEHHAAGRDTTPTAIHLA